MKSFLKNIFLLVIVLVLSYFTAEYFGTWYTKLIGSGNAWVGSEESWNFIIGFPFAYTFFTILLFQLFGSGNKNKWTIWLLIPPFLFFGASDLRHIYLPIILGLIAFGITLILQKILKLGTSNSEKIIL